MAAKSTLNAKNLEALGAGRLAELLMEISAGNAPAKRRLRLELAGSTNPEEMAKEIRKRLATIARSRSFVDWQNRRTLIDDLETQRIAIVNKIAKIDAVEAFELMWRFLALAESVHGRCDDSSGSVGDIFSAACTNLGELARLAKPSAEKLAERILEALTENGYGQYDRLIANLAPALGEKGLESLKGKVIELSKKKVERPPDQDRRAIGYGAGGPIFEDEVRARSRKSMVRFALMAIADAQGDVDAFIAQYDPKTRKVPVIAAEIAERLIAAGRAKEALNILEAAERRRDWIDLEWVDARIAAFEALRQTEEAQQARWSCFENSLSPDHLRAFLQRLPDFDDEEAETKALDYAGGVKSLNLALAFLVGWPALDRAARLAIERSEELDGDRYELLTPAAEALAGKFPLAATLMLRAMIDFSLSKSRSSRYRHAARHLMECSSLATHIDDYLKFENHDAFLERLKKEHGRKSGFWSLIE